MAHWLIIVLVTIMCFIHSISGYMYPRNNNNIDHSTITSGTIFQDETNNKVHFHGLGMLLPSNHPAVNNDENKYYFVGSSEKLYLECPDANFPNATCWLSQGINLYSSFDLMNFKLENMIFQNTSIVNTPIPKSEATRNIYRIERPKLVYNYNTKLYVLMFHLDTAHFKLGMIGVATSKIINGNYKFQHGYQPDNEFSFDMTIFQDVTNNRKTYLIRSVNNQYAGISELTDDYFNTTSKGIISKGPKCEGQTIWNDDRTNGYYMLGSHLSGWDANAAILSYTSSSTLENAQWTILGNPSNSKSTFNSQSTFMWPLRILGNDNDETTLYIYFADRWNHNGEGSVGNASYIWLPMVSSNTNNSSNNMPFVLHGLDENNGDGRWKISDYLSTINVSHDKKKNNNDDENAIIIIGGGWAGLGAAIELKKANKKFILLEAKNYIGGRSYTENIFNDGMKLDMGSSWVHGTTNNPIMNFVNEFNLPYANGDWNDLSTSYAFYTNGTAMPDAIKDAAASQWDIFDQQCRNIQKGNSSMSYEDAANIVFDKYNYNTMEQELMIWLSSILIGDCGGDDISWVSPTTSQQGCSVGGTQLILPNGYSELIDLLIEKYSLNDSIILNTPVTGIYQHQQSKSSSPIVNVQTSTSKVYTGSHVILTAPLGVLQHSFIDFNPVLPGNINDAIQNLGSGPVEKVILKFNTTLPFNNNTRPFVFYIASEEGEFPAIVNMANITKGKDQVLVFFCAGTCALIADREGKDGLVKHVLNILRKIDPTFLYEPIDSAVTRWNNDIYSRGSYSYIPTGSSNTLRLNFLKPFHNLIFAGEHVNSQRFAYTDGAYITGVSAAKSVLAMLNHESLSDIVEMRMREHVSYCEKL